MTDIRAAQALSILENLERLAPGQSVTITRGPNGGCLAWIAGRAPHAGESVTDTLGQLCTVMALESLEAT